jgi:hypothetical protein
VDFSLLNIEEVRYFFFVFCFLSNIERLDGPFILWPVRALNGLFTAGPMRARRLGGCRDCKILGRDGTVDQTAQPHGKPALSSPSGLPGSSRLRDPQPQPNSAGRRSPFEIEIQILFHTRSIPFSGSGSSSTEPVAVFFGSHLASPFATPAYDIWRRARSAACPTWRSASTSVRARSARCTSPGRSRSARSTCALQFSRSP